MATDKFILVTLILLFYAFTVFGSDPSGGTHAAGEKSFSFTRDSVFSFRSKKGFVPSLIHNFGEQAVAPFKMNGKQALMVAGAVAITGALFFADENIDRFFKPLKDREQLVRTFSKPITDIGSSYAFVFATSYGAYGILFKDSKAVRTMLLSMQAAITAGTWVRAGKMLTGRERPSATYFDFQHDFWWGPFQEFYVSGSKIKSGAKDRGMDCFDAFPSGHTSSAFAVASVFAHQYADKPFVPIAAYTIASLTGISRLTEHDHWASDVFAGACIGYLCGRQVVKHERELQENSYQAINRKKIKPDYFFSYSGNQLTVNCLLSF